MNRSLLSFSLALMAATPAITIAQELSWVQIEAHPSLAEARARATLFAQARQNVAGYALGRGWYGIALGPYTPADAERLLRQLRAEGAIPSDSFTVDGRRFGAQFFPVGTGAAQSPQPLPDSQPKPPAPAQTQQAPQPEQIEQTAAPALPEENPREARESERALSRDQKKALQEALQWAGVYSGAIDGLYGRGTRRAMGAWQAQKGFEETGILTTAQRAALLKDYNAVLEGLGLELLSDDATGIAMQIPRGVVEFARYDPPFARFDAKDGGAAQVLLISQPGDSATLAGLYEVMQTLEIVPSNGPRRLTRDSFTLEGSSGRLHSHTEARLQNGEIKGFTLVWPAGDEERRSRLLGEMRASFARLDGVLDPVMISPGAETSTDLVSGLAIRKPLRIRSGIFISADGMILSAPDVAEGCGTLQLGGDIDLRVLEAAPDYTLLAPQSEAAPQRIARFRLTPPDLRAPVALAGYPYGGVLPAATMSFGALEDIKGLGGEPELRRLSLRAEVSEYGGPVLDHSGAVIGMLVPPRADKRLPDGVAFALGSDHLAERLAAGGTMLREAESGAALTEERLTREAPEMTALLTCWE